VLVPKGVYQIGTVRLKSHIDFHLEEGSRIILSPDAKHYTPHPGVVAEGFAGSEAAIVADDAVNLKITGRGTIDGRSLQFMDHYEAENEWWIPKDFRPRLVVLTNCRDIEVRDLTLGRRADLDAASHRLRACAGGWGEGAQPAGCAQLGWHRSGSLPRCGDSELRRAVRR